MTPGPRIPSRDAASAAARELARELRRRARPHSGFDAVAYLSSPLPVLEVRAADVRSLAREFVREHPDWAMPRVHDLLGRLWAGATFEERILAIEIAVRWRRRLDDRSWNLVSGWATTATGWGLSDSLAGALLGPLAVDRPDRYRALLKWTRSANPWQRRPALYAMGAWVRRKELDRPFEVIDRLVGDPEFWVQRAVGTWLRECWKRDPARTERFLRHRLRTVSRLTLSVAMERMPPGLRAEFRDLHRSARQREAGPPGSRSRSPGAIEDGRRRTK